MPFGPWLSNVSGLDRFVTWYAKDVFTMGYMDDVMVLSQAFEEHLKHLRIKCGAHINVCLPSGAVRSLAADRSYGNGRWLAALERSPSI